MARQGRRKKGYVKVYSSIPPETDAKIQAEAARRGLDKADVIRGALIEKYAPEIPKEAKSDLNR